MDTCAINYWRKCKSRATIKKSIYRQTNLCCGKGPENWSAIIICSFHWIIFCCWLLLKEVNELNVNFSSQCVSLLFVKIKLVHPTHSMATANLNKSEEFVTNTTAAASKFIPRRLSISIN